MVNSGTTARRRSPFRWSKRSGPGRKCLGCHRRVQGRTFCPACRKRIEHGQPVEDCGDELSSEDVEALKGWNQVSIVHGLSYCPLPVRAEPEVLVDVAEIPPDRRRNDDGIIEIGRTRVRIEPGRRK